VVKNQRTSESRRVVLDANGSFARHEKIAAQPGDALLVQVSRSRNHRVGVVTVPGANGRIMEARRLARLVSGHSDTQFDVKRIGGPLLIGRPKACDVIQGEVTNCHLAGAVSAAAHICGNRIARLIRRLDGEHYSVALFRFEKSSKRWVRGSVVVSNSFYVRPCGSLLFGSGVHHGRPASSPTAALWWPVLEKAYAQFHGDYGFFQGGGTAHRALSVLLGQPPRHREVGPKSADRLWDEARARLRSKLPVVMSTADASFTLRYRNTRIMPDHCYAVLGCFVMGDRRMIRLRNPWGEISPPEYPASPDGSFSIPWEMAVRLFAIMSTVDPVG
jgi:hypothetical protein